MTFEAREHSGHTAENMREKKKTADRKEDGSERRGLRDNGSRKFSL